MSTAQPFTSTPEADSPSADPSATSASRSNGSNGSKHERHRKHDSRTQETSTPGHLGQAVASQAQEQAVKLTREARRQATTNLERQTRRAARIVGALGTALHAAGNQLRAEDEQMAASYYDMAGDRIDTLASTIEQQDAEQLIATVQRFAGRQPIVFFGAAAVIGIVGVRALKSSSSSSDQARSGQALHTGAH
jgi:hypothetical protein